MSLLVSILIPCYNSAKYIAETISCCINQDYPNIEVIVVDDGSVDNSYEIARSFQSDRVHVFQQENGGACRARNLAFERSKGDYIMYLDADDIISRDKISRQIELLRGSKEGSVATCAWGKFTNSIDDVAPHFSTVYRDYSVSKDLLIELLDGDMLQTSCWLVPRQIIQKSGAWCEALKINQDGEFFARVILNSSNILFSNEGCVYYRCGVKSSITNQEASNIKGESLLLSYQLIAKQILAVDRSKRVRLALLRNFYSVAYQYYTFPSVLEVAKEECVRLEVSSRDANIGGIGFRVLSYIFSFWRALEIRNKHTK
ncbi:MAG: glycosyltransferase family A protein [Rikenellaceae bacterium]